MNEKNVVFNSFSGFISLLEVWRREKNEEDVRKKHGTQCECEWWCFFTCAAAPFSLFYEVFGKIIIFQPLKSILWLPWVGHSEKTTDRVPYYRLHTNRKWRHIESARACVRVYVVRGMQNADNMTDFGRKFWIYHCFALKSDMLSGWALIII